MKKIIFVLVLLLFGTAFVNAVSYGEFLNTIQWAYTDYVQNGNSAILNSNEITDLLTFLGTVQPGQTDLDLSATGTKSGQKIEDIYNKVSDAIDNSGIGKKCQNKGDSCGKNNDMVCSSKLKCVKFCKHLKDSKDDLLIKGKIRYLDRKSVV